MATAETPTTLTQIQSWLCGLRRGPHGVDSYILSLRYSDSDDAAHKVELSREALTTLDVRLPIVFDTLTLPRGDLIDGAAISASLVCATLKQWSRNWTIVIERRTPRFVVHELMSQPAEMMAVVGIDYTERFGVMIATRQQVVTLQVTDAFVQAQAPGILDRLTHCLALGLRGELALHYLFEPEQLLAPIPALDLIFSENDS